VRLLADESVAMIVVRALRDATHDIVAIAETAPGASDDEVFGIAVAEQRLILTEDLDFGRFAVAPELPGVVLLRFDARARRLIAQAAVEAIAEHGESLLGRFSVLEPGRLRFFDR